MRDAGRQSAGAILAAVGGQGLMERWTRRSVIAAGLGLAGCAVRRSPAARRRLSAHRTPSPERPPLDPDSGGLRLEPARPHDRRGALACLEPAACCSATIASSNCRSTRTRSSPSHDGVEAYAVFRAGLGRDFYGEMLDTLRARRRVRTLSQPEPLAGGSLRLYVYPSTTSGSTTRAPRAAWPR